MIEITHSRAEGSLLDETSRGDGTPRILKPLGWRWSRSITSWYLPRSREQRADRATLDETRRQLEVAGHDVTVQVDDVARSAADVEADLAGRAEARAERLAGAADRLHRAAEAASRRADAADVALPPGGEPVKYGTSGARRHQRALERARTTLSASVEADQAAGEAHRRASVAADATDRHTAPATVARRIARIGAELRAAQRQIDGHTRTISRSQAGQPAILETTAPATGHRRTELQELVDNLTDQVAYWSALHDEQLTTGRTSSYGPDTVKSGDTVKIVATGGRWSVRQPSRSRWPRGTAGTTARPGTKSATTDHPPAKPREPVDGNPPSLDHPVVGTPGDR